jgi:hypothetical protein
MGKIQKKRRTAVIKHRWKLEAVKERLSERQVLYDNPPVTKDSEAIDQALTVVLEYFASDRWAEEKAGILELKRQMAEAETRQAELKKRLQDWQEQKRLRADWESLPPEEQERRRELVKALTPEERRQQQEEWNTASPEKRKKMMEAVEEKTRQEYGDG